MKNLICTLAFTVMALNGCSSDDSTPAPIVTPIPHDASYPEENPLPGYLLTTGYTNNINYIDDNNYYEMGFSFKPQVTGKINAVLVKLPQPNANIRVTIWDAQTAQPIRTILVDVPTAHVNSRLAIDPLPVEKDKEYVISMNANDYYFANRGDFGTNTYPIASGHLLITGTYCDLSNSAQVMPEMATIVNATFGFCSIVFQQTE